MKENQYFTTFFKKKFEHTNKIYTYVKDVIFTCHLTSRI